MLIYTKVYIGYFRFRWVLLTEDRLFTPETHTSCVSRFPAKTMYGPGNVDDGTASVTNPRLISDAKKKKIGNDRKC